MTPKKSFLSPTAIYLLKFMMSMWPWTSLERESCWRWILRTNSIQCHNNQVLVPPCKPPNPVKDIYDGQTYDLKIRVDIWTRVDVVPVKYGTLDQIFHLNMWFFQFIIGIVLVRIGIWTKLRIYRVLPDPVRWSCWGFGFLWRLFMLNWMLWNKNDFKVSHRRQVKAPPNIKLVIYSMNFECHPCGIFEGLSYHQ